MVRILTSSLVVLLSSLPYAATTPLEASQIPGTFSAVASSGRPAMGLGVPGVANQETKKETKKDWAFRRDHLVGANEAQGTFAAQNLLLATKSKDSRVDATCQAHRDFVKSLLNPELIEGGIEKDLIASRRILSALSLVTASGGAPYEEVSSLLLALLGRGPLDIRRGVVDALVELVKWEASRGKIDGAKASIVAGIVHNPPPSAKLLEDSSRILWRSDGKSFLSAVILGMRKNAEKFPNSTALYLHEIRGRLRIDFENPGKWAEWWSRQEARSLAEIFAACQKQISEEAALRWLSMIKKFRETQDADRLLTTIEDTLPGARTLEMRLAVVSSLAGFADWVMGIKFPEDKTSLASQRDKLLGRALAQLFSIAAGEAQQHEPEMVRRAAFVAMRSYSGYVAREETLRSALSVFFLDRLQASLEGRQYLQSGERRSDLFEILRTAGSLRLDDTVRVAIETFLRGIQGAGDIELLQTATVAMGRLLVGELRLDTARLLCSLYETKLPAATPQAESQLAELRKASVAALTARPENDAVRGVLREFYRRVLSEGAGELRIRAILGLGTLAQDRDAKSLSHLVDIARHPEDHDTQEIIAAINSIAYVGGSMALLEFLPLLGLEERLDQKGPGVSDLLWRKVVTLIQADAAELLPRALAKLENLSMSEDSILYLDVLVRLCGTSELDALFSTEGLDPGDKDRLHGLWVSTLALERALELTAPGGHAADGNSIPEKLVALVDLGAKNPQIATKSIPAETMRLEKYLSARAARRKVAEQIAMPQDLEATAFVDLLGSTLRTAESTEERWFALRWIESQITSDPVRKDAKAAALRAQWKLYLEAPERISWRVDLPEHFLERHLERIETFQPPEERLPKIEDAQAPAIKKASATEKPAASKKPAATEKAPATKKPAAEEKALAAESSTVGSAQSP